MTNRYENQDRDPPRPVDAERVEDNGEQLEIWSGEIVGALGMGGYLRDDLSYDDKVHIHALVADELRGITSPAHSPDKAVTREGVEPSRAAIQAAVEARDAALCRDANDQLSAVAFAVEAAYAVDFAHQPTGTEASRGVIPADAGEPR